ncbi:unnamed protein product [Fraxinus pennsylvanica]|uniref:NB-ARC domain-containing protein n=1 Tax=Fraxinus pennsylvanica TaxID=56036 RepID=A0AAD2DNH0_9LAMI|nr:unnamed protein product [Fraxinus pennsylvanica]
MDPIEGIVKGVFKCLGPDLEDNFYALQRKLELLTSRKDDVEEELKFSGGKKRKQVVEDWLNNVEDIITEFETLRREVLCCKFYTRQNLTEKVEMMTKEVTELLEQSDFPKGLFHEFDASLRCRQRLSYMYRLLRILRDDNISRIGIWGLEEPGDNLSIESTYFDHVDHVRVSQESSIYKLQSDIAQALKLDFSCEDDEGKRAYILSEAFKRRGRSVLILDGVMKQIDVEKIGIPVGMNGCKLIITSPWKEVCRQMDCQRIIKANSVSEQEAWELFLKKFGSVQLQT